MNIIMLCSTNYEYCYKVLEIVSHVPDYMYILNIEEGMMFGARKVCQLN